MTQADFREHFDAACDRFLTVAGHSDLLGAKTTELIWLALAAHVSLLDREGIRTHIKRAARAGASPAEVAEVLVLTSAVGSHSLAIGVPIVLDELQSLGRALPDNPLSEAQVALQDAFVHSPARPREWTPFWDAVLRLSPDYFAALVGYLDVPWEHGGLDARTKEFIYIAVDVTATHLFPDGLRGHVRIALQNGATAEEVLAVMQIASAVAYLTCDVGLPMIDEVFSAQELANRPKPQPGT